MISVIVLTFNSEATIRKTLGTAFQVSDDVHVVDSFSADNTRQIAETAGANVVQHAFEHYGIQRNWAMDHLPLRHQWQLHLDSDEYLTDELIAEINAIKGKLSPDVRGFYIARITCFLGRLLRHGGLTTWHMRLFQHGKGRCEDRRYDQHFFVEGATRKLHSPMVDDHRSSLSEWTARHNRWSDAEVGELLGRSLGKTIAGRIQGGVVERKRALREWYYRAPRLLRPFALFCYRYFLRLGFLDGLPGFIYLVLQTFWFRFLIDAKLFEAGRHEQRSVGQSSGV